MEVAELAGGKFEVSIQGEICVRRERAHDRRRATVVQHLQEEISRIVLERNPRVGRIVVANFDIAQSVNRWQDRISEGAEVVDVVDRDFTRDGAGVVLRVGGGEGKLE